jgi:1,4-dihydroxy-2-naphthoate octaprenyltransferase
MVYTHDSYRQHGLLFFRKRMTVPDSLRLYFRMSRPDQLLLVAAVYGWGVLIALVMTGNSLSAVPIFAGMVPLILVSASIHFANEYADYATDALTIRTPYSGGSGALSDYNASPTTALKAAWISLLAGLAIATLLVAVGTLPLVALPILVLGAFGGWMYSLRPLALAWRGWGEVINAFLGAMLLPLLGYAVVAGQIEWQIILLVLPFTLLAFLNLLATTWPDRAADRQVGKYTLAVRWSVRGVRRLFLLVSGLAILALLSLHGWLLPELIWWLSLLILPALFWAARAYTRQQSPFPTVFVMLLFLGIQIAGWLVVLAFPGFTQVLG